MADAYPKCTCNLHTAATTTVTPRTSLARGYLRADHTYALHLRRDPLHCRVSMWIPSDDGVPEGDEVLPGCSEAMAANSATEENEERGEA